MNNAVMSAPISIGSIPCFRREDDDRPLLAPRGAGDTSESLSRRIPDRPDRDRDRSAGSTRDSAFSVSRSETLELGR